MSEARPSRQQRRVSAQAPQPAQVEPGWLLGALGLLVLAALCCAYLSLCVLFVQGQWQLLYRPGNRDGVPSAAGLAFSAVRFGPTGAGASSGWWIPAAADPEGAPQFATTIVYLHDGTGSLGDSLPALTRLHALGCSVLAVEYRGYEAAAREHPSEATMVEDAGRALAYLVQTRHVPAAAIVLWGRGIGATIAAEALGQQTVAPALTVVLEDVNQPAVVLLGQDPRTRWLPVRLLLRDRLDAGDVVHASSAPKLFLSRDPAPGRAGAEDGTERLYHQAAAPRQLSRSDDEAGVRAFLGVAPGKGAQLQP